MSVADHTVSPIPREARPYQGLRAGVITRVAAAVLDTIVVALVLGVSYACLAGFMFLLNPRSFSFPGTSVIFGLTAAIVVSILYLAGGWALDGRTYGCHVLGLRVVSYRGKRMRPLGALVRAAFCVFFPIGLLWCAASRANRSVQDVVLRSSVVYDWEPGSPWRHLPQAALDRDSRDPTADPA